MNHIAPARGRSLALTLLVLALLAITAALVGALAVPPKWSMTSSLTHILGGDHGATTGPHDGGLPDDVTVFDDHYPGIANLDGDLRFALRAAATKAGNDGIEFHVNSGWRSPRYQDQLLREAIAKYGSQEEAARWVATADTSAHVSGNAVDIGPDEAAAWLARNGAAYGLCQIYDNEPWHYELRPDAGARGCPATYADPTEDPRMYP